MHNTSKNLRYCAMSNNTKSYQKLFQTVSLQDGYFTTKQAIDAGYKTNTHSYHIKTGNWIREHRGIYRLKNYPSGERPDLMLWYLWSRNRNEEAQGVYSHETALAIHDISDVNPDKLHMTVPKNFRRNSVKPDIIELHLSSLKSNEVDYIHGVRVTKPLKTIVDIIKDEKLTDDLIKQAVVEATNKGMISKDALEKIKRDYPILNI
jgi:predicted transcriptional regulator of viral defense system